MRPNFFISSRSRRAALMGIAKPILCAPDMIAAFTATTLEFRSTSGPPEFPGLIAASVWISPRSSCGGASGSLCAVMSVKVPRRCRAIRYS